MRAWVLASTGALLAALLTVPATPAAAAEPTRGYILDQRGRTLSAFDPDTGAITDRVSFVEVADLALRPDGQEIYVADPVSNRVVVVGTATHAVVATIPVRAEPIGIAFGPDSRTAYIASDISATVTVLDTASRLVAAVIPLGDRPARPAVSPDGRRLYVGTTGQAVPFRRVTVIDTASNRVVKSIRLLGTGPNIGYCFF